MYKGTEVVHKSSLVVAFDIVRNVKYIRAIYILLDISKYKVLDITRWTDCLSAACPCPVIVTDRSFQPPFAPQVLN